MISVPPSRPTKTRLFVAPLAVPLVMPPEATRTVPPVRRLKMFVVLSRAELSPRLRRMEEPALATTTPVPRTLNKA